MIGNYTKETASIECIWRETEEEIYNGSLCKLQGRRSPKSSIRELEIQESLGCNSVLTHRPEKPGFQETVGGRELVLLRVSEPEVLETGEN